MSGQHRYKIFQMLGDQEWYEARSGEDGVWRGDTWQEAIHNWRETAWLYPPKVMHEYPMEDGRSGMMGVKSPAASDSSWWLVKATYID